MAEWTLPAWLSAGRLVVPDPDFAPEDEEPVTEPALWVSADPMPGAGPLWGRLLALHPDSGLWPLLLMGRPLRPWGPGLLAGNEYPGPVGRLAADNAGACPSRRRRAFRFLH